MPELPEVESVRRQIASAMAGARIEAVELRRPDLRKPFSRGFGRRLTGQTVVSLTRRGKYLLVSLSSAGTLLMHLGMSGSFRVVRKSARARSAGGPDTSSAHDHVVFHMSSGNAVVFNDPRRFGAMELVPADRLPDHPAFGRLGPEPLSPDFNAVALARTCGGKKTSLKAALLDQRVVAGLGNIYASEALHVAGLSPLRPASTLATPAGAPRESACRLVAAIKHVLARAIERQSRRAYRGRPFLVYDRENQSCAKEGCGGTIRRRVQSGRSTFYCAVCQT